MTPTNPYGETDTPPGLSTGPEAITGSGNMLARIHQSLAEFTVLTGLLRAAVDARLGRHLLVTGWADGVLRVRLDQPALASRWRFAEPDVLRRLKRQPQFAGLQEIRLLPVPPAASAAGRAPENKPLPVPADALRALAEEESHTSLRQALQALADAADDTGKPERK